MLPWAAMFKLPSRSFRPAQPAKDVGNPLFLLRELHALGNRHLPRPDRGVSSDFSVYCPLTCPDSVEVIYYYYFKSLSCNTNRSTRKCCKQKTYGLAGVIAN